MSYRNYAPANGFLVDQAGNGDFKTISAASTAAVSGQLIFINTGTYTEDVTLKPGVQYAAFNQGGNQTAGSVVIVGNTTLSSAGSVKMNGISFQTNSGSAITLSGAGISKLELCNCTSFNNTHVMITCSNSNAGSGIAIYGGAWFGATGAALLSVTNISGISFSDCFVASDLTVASAVANGGVFFRNCQTFVPFTTSGTGNVGGEFCTFNSGNLPLITMVGTGIGLLDNCRVTSGTATCLNLGAGTTMQVVQCILGSNAASGNFITGAGTVNYATIANTGTATAFDGALTLVHFTTH